MRTAARSNPGPRSAGRRANGLAENAAIAGCELLVMRDHGLVPVSPFPAHQQEGQPGQGASGGSPPRLGNLPAGHRPTTPGQFGQPDCCIRSAGTCPAAGTGGTGRLCPRAVVNRAPAEPIATTRAGNGTCGARIHDRGGDLRLLVTAWGCQAATWYSLVSPPMTCCRRIRCSARLISGGRV